MVDISILHVSEQGPAMCCIGSFGGRNRLILAFFQAFYPQTSAFLRRYCETPSCWVIQLLETSLMPEDATLKPKPQ